MKTSLRLGPALVMLALIAVAMSCARGAPSLPQSVATSGASAGVAGPTVSWTVALLGSGFASETTFKSVADKFVREIAADKDFGAAIAHKQIKFVLTKLDPAMSVAKRNDGCGFSRNRDLGIGVGKVIAGEDLSGLVSLIVLNDNASVDACALGELFLGDNGASLAGPHEFGHTLGGLFDEMDGTISRPGPVVGPNCVSATEPLPWDRRLFTRAPQPGCWYDHSLLRPSDYCRMQTGRGKFCPVCQDRLAQVFTTPVPPTVPTHTQFVLQVWAPSSFDIISARTYTQPPPPQVIRGPIVLGLKLDDGGICLGGSFADPMISRGYRESVENSWMRIGEGQDDSLFVIMNCPGTVDRALLKRFQEVRITPTRDLWLTPEIFLNNRVGEPRDFLVRPSPLQ